jgi:hypothetical protein
MRVWKDIISGDEMLSDSFPMKLIYDDAAIEAKARFVTKKENEDCGIAANADADDENPSADAAVDDKTVTVIDIVDALRLQEITLDKASFMAYIKGYLKAVKEKLEASGKADRVAVFQKGATALVKELVGKWNEVQVFTGESGNWEAGLAYCYMKDQADDGPTFYLFNDGLKMEKY